MIEGGAIRLRAVELEDVELLYQWENDQTLFQFGNPATPYSRYQLKKFIETSTGDLYTDLQMRLIIEGTVNNQFIPVGLIDAFEFDPFHQRAGLGIMVHSNYRKKGFAKQAISVFTNYLFTQWHLHQVTVSIAANNEPCIKLFENSNFLKTGTKKDWLKSLNGYTDIVEFQCISSK